MSRREMVKNFLKKDLQFPNGSTVSIEKVLGGRPFSQLSEACDQLELKLNAMQRQRKTAKKRPSSVRTAQDELPTATKVDASEPVPQSSMTSSVTLGGTPRNQQGGFGIQVRSSWTAYRFDILLIRNESESTLRSFSKYMYRHHQTTPAENDMQKSSGR